MGVADRLGVALRWMRRRRGWNQRQLARAAGITDSMVSRYETGQARPNPRTLDKILHALGFELGHLSEVLRYLEDAERAANSAGRFPEPPLPWFADPTRPAADPGQPPGGGDISTLLEILEALHPANPKEREALGVLLRAFLAWLHSVQQRHDEPR